MSKTELKKLLANIEKTKAPEAKMGAMCYSPVPASLNPMQYICPLCGEKTLHPANVATVWLSELESCRRLFKELPKRESMSLDESSFCKKCQPKAKEPALNLIVRYDDRTTNTVSAITSDDLRLLKDFLKGELSYTTFNEGKQPLKNELPRLRKLLGLDK